MRHVVHNISRLPWPPREFRRKYKDIAEARLDWAQQIGIVTKSEADELLDLDIFHLEHMRALETPPVPCDPHGHGRAGIPPAGGVSSAVSDPCGSPVAPSGPALPISVGSSGIALPSTEGE